MRIEKKSELLI